MSLRDQEIPFQDVVAGLNALKATCDAVSPISGRPKTPREDVKLDVTAFIRTYQAFKQNIPENEPTAGSQFFSPSAIKDMQTHRETYQAILKEFSEKSGRNVKPILAAIEAKGAELDKDTTSRPSFAAA